MPVARVPIALENREANEKNYKDDKKASLEDSSNPNPVIRSRRLPLPTLAAIP
jgi:hypothetical protein